MVVRLIHYVTGEGIRSGDWKYLEKRRGSNRQKPKGPAKPVKLLFNLADDIGEKTNVVESNPDIVAKLKARMVEADREITSAARPVLKLKN